MDSGYVKPNVDDSYNNLSEFLSFDSFLGLCNTPSTSDHFLPSHCHSPVQPVSHGSLSYSPMNIETQANVFIEETERGSLNVEDEMIHQHNQHGINFKVNSGTRSGRGDLVSPSSGARTMMDTVPRSLRCPLAERMLPRSPRCPLAKRMLRALSLFKASAGEGILAQVWMPTKIGNVFLLSTSDQPFLFDNVLAKYREVSRGFDFSAIDSHGSVLGLPGRVFTSKRPEWTSNVAYYNESEYLRVNHAVHNKVRGSLAMPIFSPHDNTCCAVLEVVTVNEKSDFYSEMENVGRVLKDVNLMTITTPQVQPPCVSMNKNHALADIVDVLRVVCHAHNLPLALTWIPSNSNTLADEFTRICSRESSEDPKDKNILCVQKEACYVNSEDMKAFVQACSENYLKKGQGIAGKALQSSHPFFSSDIKVYDILEYPLVHHARKFGLRAAIAIRLRSIHTGTDDYILEFFLPSSCTRRSEQEQLLVNLSNTMQKISKSLRTMSDVEQLPMHGRRSQPNSCDNESALKEPIPCDNESALKEPIPCNNESALKENKPESEARENDPHRKQKTRQERRSTAERKITLSTLQDYFPGTLKEAAKSLGVCPTTMKRICRQYGISRWPSRKINKVKRSLKKIQTVIESVHGVQAGLKFDSTTGNLLTSTSNVQELEAPNVLSIPASLIGLESLPPKRGREGCTGGSHTLETVPNAICSTLDFGVNPENIIGTSSMDILRSLFETDRSNIWGWNFEGSGDHLASLSSSSMETAAADEIDGHLTSSGMTNSSNSSQTMGSASISSKNAVKESFKHITVKARYENHTVRFKFNPSAGCACLFEEVAVRFKLKTGTFLLKYQDDENEDVMLVGDADLWECLEVLESVGSSFIRLSVLLCSTSMLGFGY